MNKHLRLIYLLLLLFGLSTHAVMAQTAFASEEELKSQASKLFDDDQFEDAYPLYSQLASLYPKDPNYNYRLGVCMLYASDDKEKPIPFLEFASKKPDVDKEVFFYLARAYHLNYRFDEAIAQYQAYLKVASSAKAEKLQVERQIEMCKNGKKLLRNLTDLVVIDKKEMSRTDFYRSYDISDIGGKLLAKPDEDAFKTALDKKKKEKSIIYLATNNNQVYFSSYGDDPSRGKDIYVIRKLPTGEWSKPQTLGYPVNTEYDEDYPFLHPNGKVLYFCSKGHNSMGGYDIFKTTLNEETNTWNKPVNLDFPINTPDDDILYVTNEDEKEAYFSSARSSVTGKTAVYHINVERKPIDVAIIKGAVMKNRDNQALDVKITVKDLADNTILGIYNSKAETGVYLINLPNGGKFMYTVEAAGFATQSEVVVLPVQYEFKPLKQEISYEIGTDKLIIKNLFDEPVDDASYIQALSFIKERAKMDVNANETAVADNTKTDKTDASATQTTAADATKVDTNASVTKANSKLSNNDIIKIADDDAKEVDAEAKDLKEQADIALNFANQKNESAQNKTKEAAQLMDDASKMDDNVKKQATIDEANAASKEADQLNQETVAAFNLAKKLEMNADTKQQEADLSEKYAKDLEAAVKSKNSTEALAKLDEQQKKLEALSQEKTGANDIFSSLKIDADNKKRELDKAVKTSEDIKQEISDNETLIASTQADVAKEKNDKLKQGLLDQVEGLKQDNTDNKKELEQNDIKVTQLQKEYNGIKNETELVSTVIDKSKTGTSEDASANVANIDKAKLEQQVNNIKNAHDNTVAVTNTTKDNTTATSTENKSTTDAVVNKTNTTADNSDKTTDAAVNKTNDNAVTDNTNKTSDAVADKTNTDVIADNTATTTEAPVDYNKIYSDQIAASDNISNETERENKKAELYKNWTASINNELIQKKTAVKSEKDKDKKKELNQSIAALEKDLKEKQQTTNKAVAAAEKLNKQQPVASNPTTDNTSATNTNSTNDNSTSGNSTAETPANINQTYSEQLADADKITNESDREQAKADALKKWSEAINADVAKKKQDMDASSDPEMKALLAKKISDAEQLSKEKQTQADESVAKVERLKQTTSVASNTTTAADKTNSAVIDTASTTNKTAVDKTNTDNTVAVNKANTTADNSVQTTDKTVVDNTTTQLSYSQKLNDDITNADKTSNDLDRENKKAEAYKNYIAAANDDLTQKQTALKSEKDKTKKKELTQDIASIQSDIKEKQKSADDENAKVKTLQQSAVADNTASTTDSNPDNTDENTSTKTAVQPTFAYTAPATNEQAVKANTLTKEADDLITQANELKNNASGSDADKAAALAKADDLNKQAEDKKLEAAQIIAAANKTEFTNNQNQLEQLSQLSANNKADDVSMADMMKDESKIYYEKAKKSREAAATSTSYYEKETNMDDAYKNEMIALEKQKKAEKIYKKYNPNFTASAVNTASTAVSTDNAIVSNKTQPKNSDNTDNVTTTKQPVVADNTDNTANTTTDAAVKDNTTTTAKQPVVTDNTDNTTKTTTDATVKDNVTTTAKQPVVNDNTDNTAKTTTDAAVKDNTTTTAKQPVVADNTDNTTKTTTDATVKDNTTTTAKQPVVADNTATTAKQPVTSTETTAKQPVSDVFVKKSTPVYSINKPIPVNEKLPEGLIFKVQIGAFRNPIPQDLFKGMSPITGETTPQGFTRYTAGVFVKFETADKVKDEIRGLGYKDAFVVAFLNGKRISMSEALTMAGISPTANQSQTTTVPVADNTAKTTDQTTTTAAKQPVTTTQQPANNNQQTNTAVAETQNVSVVGGLFYTVQIGVFSQPVSSAKLHNVQPLYTETAPNGNLRYNTGVYNNLSRAAEAKNMVIDAGIKDAFVTAYYNGKRISMTEAAQTAAQGANVFSTAPNMNALPTFSGSASKQTPAPTANVTPNITPSEQPVIKKQPAANPVKQPVTTPAVTPKEPTATTTQPETSTEQPVVNTQLQTAVAENNSMPIDSGVVFKVQIGAFKDEVPLDIANQFLKIAKKGIKNYKDENGLTIYTVGTYKTYEEASQVKAEVGTEAGLKDAFITAYNNGKKISVDEAKQLINK